MTDHDLSGSRIYVADDTPANRRLLEAILARSGFTSVRSFEDGARLLDAVEEVEPDLILLDLTMPDVDGHEVLRVLRERPDDAHLPVIVLTADATSESRRQALREGANDYVTKPFDAGEVVLRARNLLETRRLHQALVHRNADLAGQVVSAVQSLSDREREWADVALSLSQLETRGSAEATAQAICDELGKIPGLSSVVVVAVDAAGQAVPLAHDGFTDVRFEVNRALPKAITDEWRDRVGLSPWVGPWAPAFGEPMQRVSRTLPTSMAIIPLRTSRTLLGALSASTSRQDGIAYLTDRLPMLESFGAVASAVLAPGIEARQQRGALRRELEATLASRAFHPVFQPVVDLATGETVGYEALTRFADGTRPDRRFADAAAVGLEKELELATIEAALDAAGGLPEGPWLSLNISPALLGASGLLRGAIRAVQRRLVLEITEHVAIEDYPAFRDAASALGPDVRYAVDDAGAGFASFRHILELRPDFVKLDIALVRDIDRDDVRQALVAGIAYFARRTGCRLIAEGIETDGEREMLRTLAVDFGQGFLLGRPARIGGVGEPGPAAAAPIARRGTPPSKADARPPAPAVDRSGPKPWT